MLKKMLSLVLAGIMAIGVCSCGGYAQEAIPQESNDTGTFTALCYNVDGLPSLDFLNVKDGRDVKSNQKAIAEYVNENGFDVFLTQEDFFYHNTLAGALSDDYNYSTLHHGGVPAGDGTTIFTKGHKIYNEEHITWDELYGIFDNGADCFSCKGITYAAIEIAEGVYIDFYDIHADAYNDEGSQKARDDNFRQLTEIIKNRKENRPVIVTGDFNGYFYNGSVYSPTPGWDFSRFVDMGFKEGWIEIHNNGNYENADYYLASHPEQNPDTKWGNWDSAEKFFYMSGDGIELDCTDFQYIWLKNGDADCSDHAACTAAFTYTITDKSLIKTDDLAVKYQSRVLEIGRRVVAFFKALAFLIKNFSAAIEELKQFLK